MLRNDLRLRARINFLIKRSTKLFYDEFIQTINLEGLHIEMSVFHGLLKVFIIKMKM